MKKANIYVAHSREFDFINELYVPLRKSEYNSRYNIILPHENSQGVFNHHDSYNQYDLVVAEVSYPSTGLGMELQSSWYHNVPIICIFKKGFKYSGSIKTVTSDFMEYENLLQDIDKLFEAINKKLLSNSIE